jgi:hypothetical protein
MDKEILRYAQNDIRFQDCDAGILMCSAPIIFIENNDKSIQGSAHRNIVYFIQE